MTQDYYNKALATVVIEIEYDPREDTYPSRSRLHELLKEHINGNFNISNDTRACYKRDEYGMPVWKEDGHDYEPRESPSSYEVTRVKVTPHDDFAMLRPETVAACKDRRLHKWDLDLVTVMRQTSLFHDWSVREGDLGTYILGDDDDERIYISVDDAILILADTIKRNGLDYEIRDAIGAQIRKTLSEFVKGEMEDLPLDNGKFVYYRTHQ